MEKNKGQEPRKINPLPLIAAAAVVVCAVAVFLVNGNRSGAGGNGDAPPAGSTSSGISAEAPAEEPGGGNTPVVEPGGTFSIPLSELTTDAGFFELVVDGTLMEIIAVKDSEGNIRTAFNTCQACYGSGRAYYVQSGDYLVCQNCESRFAMDQVEVQSNGCNPWPIFQEDKTVTDQEILFSYDFLSGSTELFTNWKTND